MKYLISTLMLMLLLASGIASAGKPDDVPRNTHEKLMFCHYDAAGDTLELKNLPVHAAAKHLWNHSGDTVELMQWALDSDGDGAYDPETVITVCNVPDEENFVLLGTDSTEDPDDNDPGVPVIDDALTTPSG